MHQEVEPPEPRQLNPGDYVQVIAASELDGAEGRVKRVIHTNLGRKAVVAIETKSRRGAYEVPVSCLRRL